MSEYWNEYINLYPKGSYDAQLFYDSLPACLEFGLLKYLRDKNIFCEVIEEYRPNMFIFEKDK